MTLARRFFLFLVIVPAIYLTAQTSTDEPVFTISVSAPTSAKDVQVRYFLTDDAGASWSSTEAQASKDKVLIRADTAGRSAKALQAIAYAPDCQFVAFAVDDLTASTRQGAFECHKLPKVQLRGKTALPPGGQALELEAMYVVRWAAKFFGLPGASISPLALDREPVEADGSFAIDLPDFASDPLWNSLSNDATLMFFLVDSKTGQRVASLKAPAWLSRGGNLKVAASYPDVTFTIQQNRLAKTAKRAQ